MSSLIMITEFTKFLRKFADDLESHSDIFGIHQNDIGYRGDYTRAIDLESDGDTITIEMLYRNRDNESKRFQGEYKINE